MSKRKGIVVKVTTDTVKWVFPAKSGRFKDAEVFTTKVEQGACPFCLVSGVVTELPAPLLAEQPDDTTHVCNPALGGCNHGFAKT